MSNNYLGWFAVLMVGALGGGVLCFYACLVFGFGVYPAMYLRDREVS